VGAGSVVTRDIPGDAIAVARGPQSIREGAAPRYRARQQAAKEARKKGGEG